MRGEHVLLEDCENKAQAGLTLAVLAMFTCAHGTDKPVPRIDLRSPKKLMACKVGLLRWLLANYWG